VDFEFSPKTNVNRCKCKFCCLASEFSLEFCSWKREFYVPGKMLNFRCLARMNHKIHCICLAPWNLYFAISKSPDLNSCARMKRKNYCFCLAAWNSHNLFFQIAFRLWNLSVWQYVKFHYFWLAAFSRCKLNFHCQAVNSWNFASKWEFHCQPVCRIFEF
jgi:hypothetical protein